MGLFQMDAKKKKKLTERIIIFCAALAALGLLVFFLSDVFFPFIKLEAAHDFDGAKELLLSRGIIGFITVSIIEALQMVVVFIPAEFIQLTSGMAYPWWLAIILCDFGVIIGCSIIYFLVNVFRFDSGIMKNQEKIERYEKVSKTKSTMLFMYILFIMPIIPFGAICYYGSGKKLPYHKYLLTCATGVIPSISTSIVMGAAVKGFIANSLPIWLLIIIIVSAAALLFTMLIFVLKKFFFKSEKGMPNPLFIAIAEKIVMKLISFKAKFRIINAEKVKEIDGPFIYLANHHSWLDAMAVYHIDPNRNVVGVVNEFYFRVPVIGKILSKAGHIKKKMFYPDLPCVRNIIRVIKAGYPIMLFPEARLSTDGGPSHIGSGTVALCKKLGVPIVFVELRNNYFLSPKWRKKTLYGTCDVEIKRVMTPEEIDKTDIPELTEIIRENLSYNEFSGERPLLKSKHKAEGLENILYICPHCRAMYSNISYKNTLKCTNCGSEYHIAEDYSFEENNIPNIYEYYSKIKDIEKEKISEINLDIPVDVKIFKDGVKGYRTEKGSFHLDAEKLYFKSELSDLYFEYKVSALDGIAYSVNEEFEMYYNEELYYFYPCENRKVCTRVALLFEILKGEQ